MNYAIKSDKTEIINPLPDMPILGSSNSAANKRYAVKIMYKYGKII